MTKTILLKCQVIQEQIVADDFTQKLHEQILRLSPEVSKNHDNDLRKWNLAA